MKRIVTSTSARDMWEVLGRPSADAHEVVWELEGVDEPTASLDGYFDVDNAGLAVNDDARGLRVGHGRIPENIDEVNWVIAVGTSSDKVINELWDIINYLDESEIHVAEDSSQLIISQSIANGCFFMASSWEDGRHE